MSTTMTLRPIPPPPLFHPSAERLMSEVRRYLRMADAFERGREIELADACGAIAGNKLAHAIRIAA